MQEISKDERFAQVLWDPKFKRMPPNEKKIHVDKRFQSMFSDEKFKLNYAVDKRGRPIQKTFSEDLRRYYAGSDDDDEDLPRNDAGSDDDEEKEKSEKISPDSESRRNDGGSDEEEKKSENISTDSESDDEIRIDLARGEGNLESSDDSESEWEFDEPAIEHDWGELDKDAKATDRPTRRFAVCNMDWDRVKSRDLLVLFRSFAPAGGRVEKVAIYPSEFGLERMKDEQLNGPAELREVDPLDGEIGDDEAEDDRSDDEAEGDRKRVPTADDDGLSSKEREKLRRYQLNRLKYFYAIVECDSAATANAIYDECDGREYESSALRLDLRFIDDGVTFDHAPPREIAQEAGDMTGYKPSVFQTTALQQASVKCTWDEADLERRQRTQNAFRNEKPEDWDDLNVYIASSSGDESEADADEVELPDVLKEKMEPKSSGGGGGGIGRRIGDYKSLLLADPDPDEDKKRPNADDVQLEISWEPGLKSTAAKIVKEKSKEKRTDELTPFQKYLQRRKEKRREKKHEVRQKRELAKTASVLVPDEQQRNQTEGTKATRVRPSEISDRNKTDSDTLRAQQQDEQDHLNLLIDDSDDQGRKHFDMKKILKSAAANEKKLKKSKTSKNSKTADRKIVEGAEISEVGGDFDVDANDPRFAALYESALYSIEPSDPMFKRTKGMEKLIDEKLKRKRKSEGSQPRPIPSEKSTFLDNELNSLVESVKRRTKQGDIAKLNKKHKV